MKTIYIDALKKLTKYKQSKKTNIRVLQTQVWVDSILYDFNLTPTELDILIANKRLESSHIVNKWFKGEHYATPSKVLEISKLLPESEHIYFSPIFSLLTPKTLTKRKLDSITEQFITTASGLPMWRFPENRENINNIPQFPLVHINDCETLFMRGDDYGFIGLLYLLKKAEYEKDYISHLNIMKNVYRALPGMCRHPYFTKRWKNLLSAVMELHKRELFSLMMLKPRIDVIEKQIYDKKHITMRLARDINLKDLRYTDPELPYKEATISFT